MKSQHNHLESHTGSIRNILPPSARQIWQTGLVPAQTHRRDPAAQTAAPGKPAQGRGPVVHPQGLLGAQVRQAVASGPTFTGRATSQGTQKHLKCS